ncbi:MAG: nucleotidyltransferase substrate binding protein [Aquificota bacterium]|nr:nucleotidyltransferase substrate binding protein [Aquificota bacterium]
MERFRRSFEKFERAFKRYEEVVKSPALESMFSKEFLVEITTKRFEYTYEAMWKCVRDFLRELGVECGSPRSCFRELIREGVVQECMEPVLSEIIRIRNELVHVYDFKRAEVLFRRVRSREILEAVETVYTALKDRLRSEEL